MRSETLYTMILEYGGGTYISQASAHSLPEALQKWAQKLDEQELKTWGLSRHGITQLLEGDPLPLEGCTHVWCMTTSWGSGLILLNIVATES